jgi:putative GTP pyrophosphokinase
LYHEKKMKNKNTIIESYFANIHKYQQLGEQVTHALKTILQEQNISVLAVKYRVKSLDNFLEKIHRKNYTNPFIEMEDICGVRIIYHFTSDITKIDEMIQKEFDVIDIINKTNENTPTQFGYRSHHYIAKIKKEWLTTPHFRGLKDIKFELQVRTVLMHAWAEIEHKLAYKKFEHMPSQFRRKFSLLSAKLEEADEQFEELMKKIKQYKQNIIEEKVNPEKNLNLDNLIMLWDKKYPKSHTKMKEMREILDRLQKSNISLEDLQKMLNQKGQTEEKAIAKIFTNKNQ